MKRGLIGLCAALALACSAPALAQTITPPDPTAGPWTTYTPTVSCGAGTLTAVTPSGRYKLIGKTLHISVSIAITTNGTCATSLIVSLPAGLTAAATQVIPGRDATISGAGFFGTVGTNATFTKYDNTYGLTSSATLVASGVVEVQ